MASCSLGVVVRRTSDGESLILPIVHGPDVVGLAIVVPRDDLHKVGLQVPHLLPARVPEVVAVPEPVLVVARQVGVEPGRHGHHVRLPVERLEVRSVDVGCHVVRAIRPSGPTCFAQSC